MEFWTIFLNLPMNSYPFKFTNEILDDLFKLTNEILDDLIFLNLPMKFWTIFLSFLKRATHRREEKRREEKRREEKRRRREYGVNVV